MGLYILGGILLGVLISVIGVLVWVKTHKAGVIAIYIPDYPDEPPYPFAEFSKSIDALGKKKTACFKVEVRPLNSQK